MTFELDPESVKMRQRANYLGQRSLGSKVVVWTATARSWTDCSSSLQYSKFT